jgi:hypothetical protein
VIGEPGRRQPPEDESWWIGNVARQAHLPLHFPDDRKFPPGLRKTENLTPSELIQVLVQGNGWWTVSEILPNSAGIHLIDSPPSVLK